MWAIRWLSQTCEALSFCIRFPTPDTKVNFLVELVERCADRVEHIAQYEIAGFGNPRQRLEKVAKDMDFLLYVVEEAKRDLVRNSLYHPQPEEIIMLLDEIRLRVPAKDDLAERVVTTMPAPI